MMRTNLAHRFKNGQQRLIPAGWQHSVDCVERLRRGGCIALASSKLLTLGARFSMRFISKRRGEHEQAYPAVLNHSRGSSVARDSGGFCPPPRFRVRLLQRYSGSPKALGGGGSSSSTSW
jgi:hypothetical protein